MGTYLGSHFSDWSWKKCIFQSVKYLLVICKMVVINYVIYKEFLVHVWSYILVVRKVCKVSWVSMSKIPYLPKKGRPKFSSVLNFRRPNFRHTWKISSGPTNNLGWQKFGLFLEFHIGVKFVFKSYISSFRLVSSHYIL